MQIREPLKIVHSKNFNRNAYKMYNIKYKMESQYYIHRCKRLHIYIHICNYTHILNIKMGNLCDKIYVTGNSGWGDDRQDLSSLSFFVLKT